MAEPVPTGSDVSARTYRCPQLRQTIDVGSVESMPPCPNCGNNEWDTSAAAKARTIRTPTNSEARQRGRPRKGSLRTTAPHEVARPDERNVRETGASWGSCPVR